MNRIPTRERSLKIRTLMRIFSIRKDLLRKKRKLALHYYKNPKILRKKVRIIYPNSGTLELWQDLTWPSEGIWPIPRWCSLLGLFFLLCRYRYECVRTMWLTDDFLASLVGAVCGKLWLVSHTNASRTKSCMVLTRSMTTTNNVQGDEPCTTALERQVQTLVVVVECLTKQNHNL